MATGLLLLVVTGHTLAAPCRDTDARIRVNQAGFLTDGPKLAIMATADTQPVDWRLEDRSGEIRLSGLSEPFGDDPPSGEHLHRIDFGAYDEDAAVLRVVTDCAVSDDFSIARDALRTLKFDALAFFYHQRSGVRIRPAFAGGRAWARRAGHRPDRATCRHGADGHGNRWPGCDYVLDVTGGWYDAGDQGKYVVSGAVSVWTLVNIEERRRLTDDRDPFADGSHLIPEAGNDVSDLLDEARYELEFLLRMQVPEGTRARVPLDVKRAGPNLDFSEIDASGMVHHKVGDERWTPLPTPPHRDRERRLLGAVSTAATLDLAAVAAQCARVWRAIDAEFSARCLRAAERAWTAAARNPAVYFVADFPGSGLYADSDLSGETFWAAAELFATTGESVYAEALHASPHFRGRLTAQPSWSRTEHFGAISLALLPTALQAEERETQRRRLVAAANRHLRERSASGYAIPFSGTSYRWGSNGVLLNRAMLLGIAHEVTGEPRYRDGVVDVVDYLLGRNPLAYSYVSGYGKRSPLQLHHRFWAAAVDPDLPGPPPGALAAGPNSTAAFDETGTPPAEPTCAPQACWRDDIHAFSVNEVAINWNAPLVWAAAFLSP